MRAPATEAAAATHPAVRRPSTPGAPALATAMMTARPMAADLLGRGRQTRGDALLGEGDAGPAAANMATKVKPPDRPRSQCRE